MLIRPLELPQGVGKSAEITVCQLNLYLIPIQKPSMRNLLKVLQGLSHYRWENYKFV